MPGGEEFASRAYTLVANDSTANSDASSIIIIGDKAPLQRVLSDRFQLTLNQIGRDPPYIGRRRLHHQQRRYVNMTRL